MGPKNVNPKKHARQDLHHASGSFDHPIKIYEPAAPAQAFLALSPPMLYGKSKNSTILQPAQRHIPPKFDFEIAPANRIKVQRQTS